MTCTFTIHPSWHGVPVALGNILKTLAALEQPRQPGDDLSDLGELLDGIDTPEPAPAAPFPAPTANAPAPARPAPQPSPATPPAREWDGVPRTGRSLYRWACDRKALPDVNRVGKSFGYPRKVTDWEPSQVAAAYAVLTTEPAQNGRPH
jgi:hypothetical protein